MAGEQIKIIVERFASVAAVIRDADPADKAEIYRGLNLILTYQPEAQTVRAQVHLSADSHGVMVGVRGAIAPISQCAFAGEFAVGSRS